MPDGTLLSDPFGSLPAVDTVELRGGGFRRSAETELVGTVVSMSQVVESIASGIAGQVVDARGIDSKLYSPSFADRLGARRY